MAHPGIHRTPQTDAARQLWKAAAAQAFCTASQLTDICRLAHALCGRSVSGFYSSSGASAEASVEMISPIDGRLSTRTTEALRSASRAAFRSICFSPEVFCLAVRDVGGPARI